MNGHVSASQTLGGFNNYVNIDVILPTNLILCIAWPPWLTNWIHTWLTKRKQLDGSFSNFASVHSGVPQGTVLGPLMFLLYTNDITEHINSKLRLFADDCFCTELSPLKKMPYNFSMTLIIYRNGQQSGN